MLSIRIHNENYFMRYEIIGDFKEQRERKAIIYDETDSLRKIKDGKKKIFIIGKSNNKRKI